MIIEKIKKLLMKLIYFVFILVFLFIKFSNKSQSVKNFILNLSDKRYLFSSFSRLFVFPPIKLLLLFILFLL
jgi:hypothetical protein